MPTRKKQPKERELQGFASEARIVEVIQTKTWNKDEEGFYAIDQFWTKYGQFIGEMSAKHPTPKPRDNATTANEMRMMDMLSFGPRRGGA